MAWNVTQKLIRAHLADAEMLPRREIGIRIDRTLTQDATGTLVMLELEAMRLDRVRIEVSAQYVDHNFVQQRMRRHGPGDSQLRTSLAEHGRRD